MTTTYWMTREYHSKHLYWLLAVDRNHQLEANREISIQGISRNSACGAKPKPQSAERTRSRSEEHTPPNQLGSASTRLIPHARALPEPRGTQPEKPDVPSERKATTSPWGKNTAGGPPLSTGELQRSGPLKSCQRTRRRATRTGGKAVAFGGAYF